MFVRHMKQIPFELRKKQLQEEQLALYNEQNATKGTGNGILQRYCKPVLTAAHIPLSWRYDFNPATNPFLMERIAINAVFNAGALFWKGRYIVLPRIEAADRKSFFAIAESPNGIDQFRFWDQPISLPDTPSNDTNVYDMRLVEHEDGWIYGLFCTERRNPAAAVNDQSSAIAQCGIVRTKDLKIWERLPNLLTHSPQQRNVVLHPEFYKDQYAFYTRPQDGFIETGNGGGIGFGLSESMDPAVIRKEIVLDPKIYHSVAEMKNGLGPAPLKTSEGWLHLAHGVRPTAAGLRYVLYLFMTDLKDITRITHKPAGYFMAPEGDERVGDVSNVLFSNGWIATEDGNVLIYYASSDSRLHVAQTSIAQLLDYVKNTAPDGNRSSLTVNGIKELIQRNNSLYSDF